MVDFSAFINTTLVTICIALHIYLLFYGMWHTGHRPLCCPHNHSMSIAAFFLHLWPALHTGQNPKLLLNVKTQLDHPAYSFFVSHDKQVHVIEQLRNEMIHQGIVILECIILVPNISHVQPDLNLLWFDIVSTVTRI